MPTHFYSGCNVSNGKHLSQVPTLVLDQVLSHRELAIANDGWGFPSTFSSWKQNLLIVDMVTDMILTECIISKYPEADRVEKYNYTYTYYI